MAAEEYDFELTQAVGARALAYLKEFGRQPSPANYALLYHHTTGHDRALSNAIQTAIGDHGGLTAEEAERLHARYLSPADRVAPVQAALASEIANAMRLIDRAADNTDDLWFSLQVAKLQLSDREADADVAQIVKGLVEVSQQVGRQNYVLEQQLAASQEQVDQLRKVLFDIGLNQDKDRLSNLPGRAAFHRALDDRIARVASEGGAFRVLLLNLDDFRKYNDAHGHKVGDQILSLVAGIVASHAGRDGLAARYGGDEFALLLREAAPGDGGKLAEQLRVAILAQKFVRKSSGRSLGRVTASFGVAAYAEGDDAAALMARARAGLLRAKEGGRNRIAGDGEAAPEAPPRMAERTA